MLLPLLRDAKEMSDDFFAGIMHFHFQEESSKFLILEVTWSNHTQVLS